MAKKIPFRLEKHGHIRVDDYYWLRERENPAVIAYLDEENQRTAREMAHTQAFEEKLFEEITGRIKQTDMSVPYRRDDYFYYTRYEAGKEYPIYARRKGTKAAPEEILLNVNEMAKGHDFFAIGDMAVSPNGNLLAWAEDTVGRRQFVAKVMDLTTHTVLPIALPNVEDNLTWAGDNQQFLYVEKDPVTLLGSKIRKHSLSSANHTDVAADPVVWEQKVDGIPLFEATFISHTTRNGELVNVSSQFVPDPVAQWRLRCRCWRSVAVRPGSAFATGKHCARPSGWPGARAPARSKRRSRNSSAASETRICFFESRRRNPHERHTVASLRDSLGRADSPVGGEPHPARRRRVPVARPR